MRSHHTTTCPTSPLRRKAVQEARTVVSIPCPTMTYSSAKASVAKYWYFVLLSIKQNFAYRSVMLISLVTGPISFFAQYVIWTNVFSASGKEVLAGFTLEQTLVYYAAMQMVIHCIWDDAHDKLMHNVHRGELVTYLLRPLHYLWYSLSWKIGYRLLAIGLQAVPVVVLIGSLFGFDLFVTNNLTWFLLSLVTASIIQFELNTLAGLTSFWLQKPRGMLTIYKWGSRFLGGFVIPISFFPSVFEKLLFVLPFQFTMYAPASIFSGDYQLAGFALHPSTVVLVGTLYASVLAMVIYAVWHKALNRFTAVGT